MLSIININDPEKWDSIVRSFADYDVCYLSGYARAFQLRGDGEPILFYYDDGVTRAVNVVMKRDISLALPFKGKLPKNLWFDLSTPYGYGGFWIQGDGVKKVEAAYLDYCREQGFVSEFVRFHLLTDYKNNFNGVCETYTHNVIRTLKMPLDEMLMDFKHSVRKSLNKSCKAGLEVELDFSGERLDQFLGVYHGTMDRNNVNPSFLFSKDFFHKINELIGNYLYVHVLHDSKVISTELILYDAESCYSFLGGTDHNYYSLQPNSFLKYEAIKWAKANGLKQFILGGGYGADDGIFKYKQSLAPNGVYEFYVGKRIFDEARYSELLAIRSSFDEEFDSNTLFFPKYRAC